MYAVASLGLGPLDWLTLLRAQTAYGPREAPALEVALDSVAKGGSNPSPTDLGQTMSLSLSVSEVFGLLLTTRLATSPFAGFEG